MLPMTVVGKRGGAGIWRSCALIIVLVLVVVLVVVLALVLDGLRVAHRARARRNGHQLHSGSPFDLRQMIQRVLSVVNDATKSTRIGATYEVV
jgi:hypothetical protein